MREGLAALGVGAFALGCCALAPIVVGVLGGVALAPLLGVGAGLALALAVVSVSLWRAHRSSCAVEPGAKR